MTSQANIPSGALLVYKSKAAFVGLEEPLRSSHLLDGLGTSKQAHCRCAFINSSSRFMFVTTRNSLS
jgi:hypothetical protein